jgi:hypothetical protein
MLTVEEQAAIQRIVEQESRTTSNVCTLLVRERLQERVRKGDAE